MSNMLYFYIGEKPVEVYLELSLSEDSVRDEDGVWGDTQIDIDEIYSIVIDGVDVDYDNLSKKDKEAFDDGLSECIIDTVNEDDLC